MSQLQKTDFQFEINHKSVKDFKQDERVFLKSNPEINMTVQCVFNNQVYVSLRCDASGYYKLFSFSPECLLQYKWRSLLVWKDKYFICLN